MNRDFHFLMSLTVHSMEDTVRFGNIKLLGTSHHASMSSSSMSLFMQKFKP